MTGNSAFGKLSHVLAFPFRGERWLTNLLIAALLCFASSIVPLVPIIFLLGYLARIARDILESSGEELELPEWNDWGRLFTDGLNLLGGTIIFWLPIAAVYLFSAFIWIIPAMFADGSGMNGPGTGFAIFMILSTLTQILISFVTVAFSLFIGITQPAFLTHLIAEKRFSAIFQFKAWWQIFRHNFTDFLLIFLLMIGLSYVYTMILFFLFFSIILCCLTPFFMAVGQAYLSVVYAAMVAYAYRFGAQKASLAQPAQPETASPAPADDAPTPAPDTTEEPPAVDEPPAEEA
ncbi:MAG: DUF4013 domain-containing protein, partial [Anaerolineaceae bacterium]|nr:DUF4013 domain-containing protein [Anaerolineaceae bacterium]